MGDFQCLMTSDNFDQGYALVDDEMALMSRMRTVMDRQSDTFNQTVSTYEGVKAEVTPLIASRYSESEFIHFYNFALGFNPDKFAFLGVLRDYLCDTEEFVIASSFFQLVSHAISAACTAVRMVIVVRQMTADPESRAETKDHFSTIMYSMAQYTT